MARALWSEKALGLGNSMIGGAVGLVWRGADLRPEPNFLPAISGTWDEVDLWRQESGEEVVM